jgi:enamine deaminase RidA (YjgF/YER057c/UK114 family)
MNHVVGIKTYLTDLGAYAVFSRIRGEFFPKDLPTRATLQVAGLLLNASIEIDAVAFLPAGRMKAIRADYRARTA